MLRVFAGSFLAGHAWSSYQDYGLWRIQTYVHCGIIEIIKTRYSRAAAVVFVTRSIQLPKLYVQGDGAGGENDSLTASEVADRFIRVVMKEIRTTVIGWSRPRWRNMVNRK